MKVFILTTILAPYRIIYFNELGKYCDLTVCFEAKAEAGRDESWYNIDCNNFKAIFLKNWDKPKWKVRTDVIKYMKYANYDVAIAFEYSTPTALLFMLTNIIIRKPYCINADGGFISSSKKAKSLIKKFFIKRAEGCLASGKNAGKYFIHYGAIENKIYYHNFTSLCKKDIIGDPISFDNKNILKTELNIPLRKTAISVGQFIYRKGFDVLIKAWKEINSEYNLLIVGGGEKEKENRELIKELNLKNIEIVVGFKKNEELIKYYKASDLFILPTREDTWGLVINEAMACGLPVITTDRCIAGLELIKDYENGFIVPVERADILAKRIEEVLSDEKLATRMGKTNLEKIRPYTVENMARQHFNIFKKILDI